MPNYGDLKNREYYNNSVFARKGFRVVEPGFTKENPNETYHSLQMIEETQLSISCLEGDSITNRTLPKGFILYGLFEDINLISGSLIAYIA